MARAIAHMDPMAGIAMDRHTLLDDVALQGVLLGGSNRSITSFRSTASLRSSRWRIRAFKRLEPPRRLERLERFERLERLFLQFSFFSFCKLRSSRCGLRCCPMMVQETSAT